MLYNFKYKIKKAFTLLEIILALIIFSTLIGILFTTYININKSELNISNQQLISKTTNDFLEKLHDLSTDYTIDYEEYFNRQLSNCQNNTFEFIRNIQGSCNIFSNYGNTGNENISGPYYCNSTNNYSSVSGYQSFLIGSQGGCRENLTGNQYYGEYKRQFRDTTDEYLNDGNDLLTGIGPISIPQNTGVQELYLINKSGDSRVLFRRKYITGFDIDGDGFFTGDKEGLYSIQTLKLKGFDAGLNHNFETGGSNWGVYDSFIDTRACDNQAGFVCTGDPIGNGEYSGYNLPTDIDDGWVDITDSSVTISSRNFEIYPVKDPYLAKDDQDNLSDPFIKITLSANIYKSQIDENIILQTSIGFKNPYFNFDREEFIEQDIHFVCGDGIVTSPNSNLDTELCDDGNSIDDDGCGNDCQPSIRIKDCDPIDTTGHKEYNWVSSITQECNQIQTTPPACLSWLPPTVTEYNPTGSSEACYFKCEAGYIWSGDISTCESAASFSSGDFVTIRQTDLPGASNDTTIQIPTNSSLSYNYDVDCQNDGIFEITNQHGNVECTYSTTGQKTVRIRGQFPQIYFNAAGDRDKILGIKQRGTGQRTSMEYSFAGCDNLGIGNIVITDNPDLSLVTNINWMFSNSPNFNQNIGNRNTSNIENMLGVFKGATNFNQDLNNWDVSNVWDMQSMFYDATSFDGDITNWQTTSATHMTSMFNNATNFNQDLSGWVTSGVVGMKNMFNNAISFDQNLGSWNIQNVTEMTGMFNGVTLSTENYDAILTGWSSQTLQTGVEFDGGNSQYCLGEFSRSGMIDNDFWIITDGGRDTNCGQCPAGEMRNPATNSCIISIRTGQCSAIDNTGHQIYNIVSQISQSCLGTSEDGCLARYPTTGTIYNEMASTTGCYFKCESGYIWNGGICEQSLPIPGIGDFVTIWQTDLTGITNNKQIRIPTYRDETYNYYVDCNDDLIWDTTGAATQDVVCTYQNTGVYTVRIAGDFPRIYFQNTGDKQKLLSVKQRGTGEWSSMGRSFQGCSNLGTHSDRAIDKPNLSNVDSLQWMFAGAINFNKDIGLRETDNITNMGYLFYNATNFNQDIGGRDTSKVTDMSHLFNGATHFNQPIGGRITSGVLDMSYMFNGATNFNQDISSRDISNVTDISHMFAGANVFNQPIGGRDTANVTNTSYMFAGATNFNQPIGGRNTFSIQNMASMFAGADAFNQNIGGRNTSNVTDMKYMFFSANAFNQPIGGRITSGVLDMSYMFNDADSFNQSIGGRDTSNVTNMASMFANTINFNQLIGGRNTSNVTDMNTMFANTTNFNQPIGGRDTSNVINMSSMFAGADLFNQPIGGRDTSNVTSMFAMFNNADTFNQNLTGRDTSKVSSMRSMFAHTFNFNGDITNWNTSELDDPRGMFYNAIAFNQDIGGRDVSDVRDTGIGDSAYGFNDMFEGAISFNQDLSSWDVAGVNYFQSMFKGATSFDQDLSSRDVSSAKMTTLAGQPGAFSDMFDDSGLSKENYDAILIGWSVLTYGSTPYPIELGANNIYYCNSESQRNYLSGTLGRIITDGGKHISCP